MIESPFLNEITQIAVEAGREIMIVYESAYDVEKKADEQETKPHRPRRGRQSVEHEQHRRHHEQADDRRRHSPCGKHLGPEAM